MPNPTTAHRQVEAKIDAMERVRNAAMLITQAAEELRLVHGDIRREWPDLSRGARCACQTA